MKRIAMVHTVRPVLASFPELLEKVVGEKLKIHNLLDDFLANMYGKKPTLWSEDLTGHERLRCITNYLTRMRLTDAEGRLEFSFKDALDEPMPEGFKPWFEFESKVAQTHQIIFGHWAALQGKTISLQIQNVDGGCVWGNQLIAYRLEDQSLFSVDNPVQL